MSEDEDGKPPKEVIAQRYKLIEEIGKGGMGSVWRAEHTSLRTNVAIKLLDPKLAKDATLRARFLREAQSAAALTSIHIVRILDHGVDDELPYIAMEFLAGESLRTRLRRMGALPLPMVAKIFSGVSRGVARAHRAGVVHRDLKPDNIFITRDEEQGEVVKVLDFGIAKLVDTKLGDSGDVQSIATETGTMLGTPYYMSPEQLRGKKQIDGRSDLWALGVIAFECVTGKRPFHAEAMGELVLKICSDPAPVPSTIGPVPPGFDAWFLRAVTVDVEQRFQTIQEMANGLAAVLSPDDAWLPTDPEPSGSWPRGRTSGVVSPDSFTPNRLSTGALAATALANDQEASVPTATAAVNPLSSTSSKLPPRAKQGKSPAVYAGVAAALIAAGAGVFLLASSKPDPTPAAATSAPAAPASTSAAAPDVSAAGTPTPSQPIVSAAPSAAPATSVAITFEASPTGAEVVAKGGKVLGEAPGPFDFDRGDQEITVTVRKLGFTSKQVKLTPDQTKTIKVELVRAKRPSDVLD